MLKHKTSWNAVLLTVSLISLAWPMLSVAQNVVVLDSTATAYRAGQEIASGRSVQLGAGEKLTLITESGSSLELVGPINGPINTPVSGGANSRVNGTVGATNSSSSAQVKTLIQRLTAQKAVDNSALGVIRQPLPSVDMAQGATPSDLFTGLLRDIPVGLTGKFCVQNPGKPLRFKGGAPDQILRLKAVADGDASQPSAYQVALRNSKQGVWNWPGKLPMRRNAKYLLRDGEASIPYLIELTTLKIPKGSSQAYAAALLASKGCGWQAEALAAAMN